MMLWMRQSTLFGNSSRASITLCESSHNHRTISSLLSLLDTQLKCFSLPFCVGSESFTPLAPHAPLPFESLKIAAVAEKSCWIADPTLILMGWGGGGRQGVGWVSFALLLQPSECSRLTPQTLCATSRAHSFSPLWIVVFVVAQIRSIAFAAKIWKGCFSVIGMPRVWSSGTIPVGDRKVWKLIYIFYLKLPHRTTKIFSKMMHVMPIMYSKPLEK